MVIPAKNVAAIPSMELGEQATYQVPRPVVLPVYMMYMPLHMVDGQNKVQLHYKSLIMVAVSMYQ